MSSPTRPSRSSRGPSQQKHKRYKRLNRDVLVVPRNFARDLAQLIEKKEEEELKIYEMELRQIDCMRNRIATYKRQIEYLLDSYKIAHRKEMDKTGSDKVIKQFLHLQGLDAYAGIRGDQNYFKNHMAVSSFLENTFLRNMGIEPPKVGNAQKTDENMKAEEEGKEVRTEPDLSPSESSFVEHMYEYEELPNHEQYKMPRF